MASCLRKLKDGGREWWRVANRVKKIEGDIMDTNLNRCLNVGDLVLMGLSHMLGAGVYVLTATSMKFTAGASVVLSYLIAGVVAFANGLCYAQFSANVPKAGSAYNYVYVVSGELWGFLAGWNMILEYLILVAAVSRSLSGYIDSLSGNAITNATLYFANDHGSPWLGHVDLIGGGICLLFFIIIAIGMGTTMTMINITTVVNIIVLIIISLAGFIHGSPRNFNANHGGFFPYGIQGTIAATAKVFYAYTGFDAIAIAAEETANPSKYLPLGMILCILSAGVLYCSVSLSLSFLISYDQLNIQIPFPDALRKSNLTWLSDMVLIGSMFGIVASLIGQAYCLPRTIYAMACDGLLWHQFKYVHPWTKTPLVAVGVSAAMAFLLTVIMDYQELIEMVAIGSLFAMSVMLISILKLHYLPADLCPFELLESTQEQGDLPDNEETPIFPKEKHIQRTARIGKPRYFKRFLRSDSEIKNTAIGILCVSLTLLSLIVSIGWDYVKQLHWWAVIMLSVLVLTTLGSIGLLLLFEPNRSFAKFSIPLIPFLPALTLFCNLYLMMNLGRLTWIRLVVWIIIGILIYSLYGSRRSTVDEMEMHDLNLDETLTSGDQQESFNESERG